MKTLLHLWSKIKKWFCPKSITDCEGNCECGKYQPAPIKPKTKTKAKSTD